MTLLMHEASITPNERASYLELYRLPSYKAKQERKLRHAKKLIRRDRVVAALGSNSYWKILGRSQRQYPESGGRDNLYYLVGKYCIFHKHVLL